MNNTIYNQKTKRLTLRKLGKEDCSFILELVNSDGWLEFIGDRNVRSENDSLKYIESITRSFAPGDEVSISWKPQAALILENA